MTAMDQVAPDIFKALTVPSDKMVRRSAAEHEDLKPYRKSEKKTFLLEVINKYII